MTDKLITANPYGRTSILCLSGDISFEADDTTAVEFSDQEFTDEQMYELETETSSDLTPDPSPTRFEVSKVWKIYHIPILQVYTIGPHCRSILHVYTTGQY